VPLGQLHELPADLVERQPDVLREHDEGDPAEHRPGVAAVPRAGALGDDETPLVVVAQRGGGDAAAPRDLADRQEVSHEHRRADSRGAFKRT